MTIPTWHVNNHSFVWVILFYSILFYFEKTPCEINNTHYTPSHSTLSVVYIHCIFIAWVLERFINSQLFSFSLLGSLSISEILEIFLFGCREKNAILCSFAVFFFFGRRVLAKCYSETMKIMLKMGKLVSTLKTLTVFEPFVYNFFSSFFLFC